MTTKIISYSDSQGYDEIKIFLTTLSQSNQKNDITLMRKIVHQLDMLTIFGPNLGMPQSKQLRGLHQPLYELRPQPERIFYAPLTGNRIILLHHYTKRQNKTSSRQVQKAIHHYKDWLRRKETK